MPRHVIKPNPDKDEYVLWSTVIDNAVSPLLTREEMIEHLIERAVKQARIEARQSVDEPYAPEDEYFVNNLPFGDGDEEYVLKGSDLRDFCVAQERNDIATMKKLTRLVEETSHDNLC